MPGDRITLATVPDAATAELLREVLHDGGVEDVEVVAAVGMVYLPRPGRVDYEVRVQDFDEARARLVLADFEEQSGQAATSQASVSLSSDDALDRNTDGDDAPLRSRKAWVFWVAVLAAILFIAPILFTASGVLWHFVSGILSN